MSAKSSNTAVAHTTADIASLGPHNVGLVDLEKNKTLPPTSLDWDGEDDPDNPLSWSKWKRLYHIYPPALISFTAFGPLPRSMLQILTGVVLSDHLYIHQPLAS